VIRFSSVRLSGYGRFDNRTFDFPRMDGAPDIHLVVGENEAGKTTLKHALVDVLFGVSGKSPYAFRDVKPRVAAEVDVGDTRIAFEREAGRKNTKPVEAAAVLGEVLNGHDAATFRATQAFSHDEMREHSRLLHESRGELKDLLMRDAGGLSEAVTLLEALQGTSGRLFKKKKVDKSTAFMVAAIEYEKAMKAAAGLDATRHRDLIAAREEAEGRREEVRRLFEDKKALAERLGRERQAERVVERLVALEAQLAHMPDVRLAPGAVERVGRAAVAEAAARTRLESAIGRRAALEEERRAVPLDDAALALAAEIDDVAGRLAELGHRQGERLAKSAEMDAGQAEALSRARAIGLRADDAAALADALPAAVDRREAGRHMGRRNDLLAEIRNRRNLLEEAAETPPEELPEGPGEALISALDCVKDLGRYRETWRSAVAGVESAREALRRAEAAAAGDGDCDAPPPPEEGDAAQEAIGRAKQALEAAEDRVAQAEAEVAARAREARRMAAGDVPMAPVLAAARERRDGLWREFVAGRAIAEAREEYEAHVAEADRIADVRFERNKDILNAESAERDLAAARETLALAVAARDARREAHGRLRGAWAARLAAAGLGTVPADYRAWHARRAARREAAHALERAESERDRLRARLIAAARDCHAALGREAGEDLDGDALLAAVDRAAKAAEEERDRLEEAVRVATLAAKARAERARERPLREKALEEAKAAFDAWAETWRALAARCGVPEDTAPERLADILDGFAEIEQALHRADACRRAIAATDALGTALADEVARLAAALDEAPGEDVRATGRRLVDRLDAARKAAADAGRIDRDLAAARKDEADQKDVHAAALGAMAADREAAGLPPDATAADLQRAADASDERRRLEAGIAAARDDLSAAGFAWPAAREALAKMSAAERAANAEGAREDADRLQRELEDAATEAVRAKDALERAEHEARGGAASVARARLEANVQARAMADAAAEAIRRRLEIAVLSAARDTFEAEHRSPVLDRASRVFAAFTGGAYDRLERGWSEGQSFVRARRAGRDETLDVTALSDGTRDQLVASVRIAAAEESALPFIADDLFVNADDDRARHGFRVLAELARGRQVIYLTHHVHLETLAREAVGDGLSVLRL